LLVSLQSENSRNGEFVSRNNKNSFRFVLREIRNETSFAGNPSSIAKFTCGAIKSMEWDKMDHSNRTSQYFGGVFEFKKASAC
jgi:hypothetical protein